MPSLIPDLTLRCAPNIKLLVESPTDVKVLLGGIEVSTSQFALAVLDAFAKPTQASAALKALQPRVAGLEDWVDLTTTIQQFHEAGILLDSTTSAVALNPKPADFDSAAIHVRMLNDRARTAAYIQAIRELVKPGDVVIDLGTGTGVLATAAAQAGARHVYAIEATGIGEVARQVFRANGLEDRITLVPGWSTQISLPERADILVSEIIGNEPLGERVLESTADACRRLLKPDARLIPGRLKIMGLPVSIPAVDCMELAICPDALRNWRSWYGIDFSPLLDVAHDNPQTIYLKPHKARDWTQLAEPQLLADVDLKNIAHPTIDTSVIAQAALAGELNGLLIYFELELSPGNTLSTHPMQTDRTNSWLSLVWVFSQNLSLEPGEAFRISYRYRVPGTRDRAKIEKI